MKKILFLILATFMMSSSACKKDALKIDVEKTYVEEGANYGTLGFGGIILTIKPDGIAEYLFSGDIMYRSKYKITGKYIILSDNSVAQTKFKIISSTTIEYDSDGVKRLLRLQE